jgi:hypothetical protein
MAKKISEKTSRPNSQDQHLDNLREELSSEKYRGRLISILTMEFRGEELIQYFHKHKVQILKKQKCLRMELPQLAVVE